MLLAVAVECGRMHSAAHEAAIRASIHSVVDTNGRPLALRLTPGQQHEATVAEELLDFVPGRACLADGAYDADWILAELRERDLQAVIPPSESRNRQRRFDRLLYRLRYRVEVFFHQLKAYRRIATRYDKTAHCYCAFLYVACALLWC